MINVQISVPSFVPILDPTKALNAVDYSVNVAAQFARKHILQLLKISLISTIIYSHNRTQEKNLAGWKLF